VTRMVGLSSIAASGLSGVGVFGVARDDGSDDRAEALRRRLVRLALDVHDGPMQDLVVVGYRVADLRRQIEPLLPRGQQTAFAASVWGLVDELGEVEQGLRALLAALERGAAAVPVPLLSAIEAEIAAFRRHSSAQIELIVDGKVEAETASQRIVLESLAREALTNIAKHSEAANVTICLHGTSESIGLEVRDDGKGFSASTAVASGRLGLRGMAERVGLLDGKLSIRSRIGGPTVVAVTLQRWRSPAA